MNAEQGETVSANARVRWKTRARSTAFLVVVGLLAVMSVTLRPQRATPTFRIDLPDTAFVLPEDWVTSFERVNHQTDFTIQVPSQRVPTAVLEGNSGSGGLTGVDGHAVYLRYEKVAPSGGPLHELLRHDGWRLLPDNDSDFKVATFDRSVSQTRVAEEAYEVKADPRQMIRCDAHYDANDAAEPRRYCRMSVQYLESCKSETCTRLGAAIPFAKIRQWRELAESERKILRPFEVQPDLNRLAARSKVRQSASESLGSTPRKGP